ncbi:Endonuclease/exonuclease/phosphatase [Mycotypha africana]|uniref:Endonuclease/exonuclease/phosphatase n=1 Tax=Mycotypha africana TaxID=64632 RepID=UPI0023016468|nr:Endonuclease/exonuclease/phosphatase [Mycotypha africana]KAI8979541.1 Endonuclease/exonuclease/phosphatase [Mycotypha africana]
MSKIPANIEELRRLKKLKKAEQKLKSTQGQQKHTQQVEPKVLRREFVDVPTKLEPESHKRSRKICVMTFNVLAQLLIKRELFSDKENVIKWKPRRKMIIDEIRLYSPDILALQELDNYDTFYQQELIQMGYNVEYCHHPTKKHGCAIAFKEHVFKMVDYETIDYGTDHLSLPSYGTGNIAQLIALQYKNDPIGFIVGNTHLYWRPIAGYERARQSIIYSNTLLEFYDRISNDSSNVNKDRKWIPFLFGDFNTTPDEPAHAILLNRQLTEEQYKELQESYSAIPEDIDKTKLDSIDVLLEKYRPMAWKSMYNSSHGALSLADEGLNGEPKYTNYAPVYKGCLDYLFYDMASDIIIQSILSLPKEESLQPSLPNKNFGSDHLCLTAMIEF